MWRFLVWDSVDIREDKNADGNEYRKHSFPEWANRKRESRVYGSLG